MRRRRGLPIIIVVVGLLLFLGMAGASRVLYNQTEDRLLQQRTSEAGQAIELTVSQRQAPLEAAAALAFATHGDGATFEQIMDRYIGAAPKPFGSAALYRVGSDTPITSVGSPTVLGTGDATRAMLDDATKQPFVIVDLLNSERRSLGYAVADRPTNPSFVVYAERALSPDPNTRTRNDQPFSQLDYAFYLGDDIAQEHLITSSVRDLPLHGRTAQQTVDFGNTKIMLDMAPIGHLSGDLFANLWWIVALGGIVVATAFALLTRRLLDRGDVAEQLATENERLFDEQRQIAETLQLSLLPQHFVAPRGVSVTARYWPAGSANLIGGDFYDMFAVDDHRWGVAIGDVCGKGIEAAALTGLARHTLRAAARNSNTPDEVLQAVHRALKDHQPSTFCTACFAYVHSGDGQSYRIEMALGGHPQPLLRRADGVVEPVGELGMLLGMLEPELSNAIIELAPGDTLVLFTDGLTDAPPQQAVSIEELATLLREHGDNSIEALADSIRALKRGRRPLGSGDDTAILILRYDPVAAAENEEPTSSEPRVTAGGSR
jgi:serine phosphatase RsbU (regulator of sigma subunit)